MAWREVPVIWPLPASPASTHTHSPGSPPTTLSLLHTPTAAVAFLLSLKNWQAWSCPRAFAPDLSPPRRQHLQLFTWLAPLNYSDLGSSVPPSLITPSRAGLPSLSIISLCFMVFTAFHTLKILFSFICCLSPSTNTYVHSQAGQVCLVRHPFPHA